MGEIAEVARVQGVPGIGEGGSGKGDGLRGDIKGQSPLVG
jgi:hypothetical protein